MIARRRACRAPSGPIRTSYLGCGRRDRGGKRQLDLDPNARAMWVTVADRPRQQAAGG
jgi:hypothetical protein